MKTKRCPRCNKEKKWPYIHTCYVSEEPSYVPPVDSGPITPPATDADEMARFMVNLSIAASEAASSDPSPSYDPPSSDSFDGGGGGDFGGGGASGDY